MIIGKLGLKIIEMIIVLFLHNLYNVFMGSAFMSHEFEDFGEFCSMKESDYFQELKLKAMDLPLKSIVDELDLYEIAVNVARERNYKAFKGRPPILFRTLNSNFYFEFNVSPEKTILSSRDFEIRGYGGKEAICFYEDLFKMINQEIRDYDVPF